MKPRSLTSLILASSLVSLVTASSALALTYQWDTNGSTAGLGSATTPVTWNTTSNLWDLTGAGNGNNDGTDATQAVATPFSASDAFQFGGTAGTVNLSSSITSIASGLTFNTASYILNIGSTGQAAANNTAISGPLTLGGSLTINPLGASGKATTVTLSGPISGSGSLGLGSTATGLGSGQSFFSITGNNSGVGGFTGAVNIVRTNVTVESLNTLGGATGANITLGSSNSGFAAGLTFTNLGGAVSTSRIRFNNGGNTLAVRNNDSNAANTLTLTNSSVSTPSSGSNTTTLEFGGSNTGDNTVSWNIANPAPGTGSTTVAVKKGDAGKWILAGANTYTGTTTVSGGTLLVNGSTHANSAVSVASSATLGGTGTLGGTVNVTGVLAPGASIESLASGALTMVAGSKFQFEAANAGTTGADLMVVNGNLSLTGVTLDLSLANLGLNTWQAGDKLTLLSYTGADVTGGFNGFLDNTSYTFGSNQWMFDYNDTQAGDNYLSEATGNRFVTMTVIPEPAAALLGGLGLLGLLRRRR